MSRAEIKAWAKAKLHENFWPICGTVIVALILTNLGYYTYSYQDGVLTANGYSFGWILYFVTVGLAYYMVKLINNKNPEFKDLFHFGNDFLRCLGASILQIIFVFLWCLLLIVPGIIKLFGYALVPYLLADEKYKDMKVTDVLKKSQEMMNGHKWDYFVFCLSFILWFMLVGITFGIAIIYVGPYQQVACAKFLNDIKLAAEGEKVETKTVAPKFCPQCGKEVAENAEFCSECGTQL